jgi:hypothetical protein
MDEQSLLASARRIACVAVWLASVAALPAEAATLTVTWDPNPESGVYRITSRRCLHAGTAHRPAIR